MDYAGNVLAHYGRLGMKWGIRRTRQQLEADPVGENSLADPDAVRAVRTQQKIKEAGSLNVVSSKELQDLVKRMELEQKYVKATLESKPETKKGEGFVKKLIRNETESYFLKGKKGPLTTMVDQLLNPKKDDAPSGKPSTGGTAKATTKAAKTATKAGARATAKTAKVITKSVVGPRKTPVYNITSIRR